MTPEEKESLKAELRSEILHDLLKDAAGWEIVKMHIKPYLKGMDYFQSAQTIGAVSSLIRHGYGIRHVTRLSTDDTEECLELVKLVGEWLNTRRFGKAEV